MVESKVAASCDFPWSCKLWRRPNIRSKVVSGMYALLSSDWPNAEPRCSSTPTIVNGSSLILIVRPIGSSPAKNLSLRSVPITQTIAECSTSCGSRNRPSEMLLSSISAKLAVTPAICVPNNSWPSYFRSVRESASAPTSLHDVHLLSNQSRSSQSSRLLRFIIFSHSSSVICPTWASRAIMKWFAPRSFETFSTT